MDKRLKDKDLVSELPDTFLSVEEQLKNDYKRWGDEWKKRGLIYKNLSQEERFFDKMLIYAMDWKENNVPIPWTKIIGEAHICLVREKHLKDETD